MIVQACGVFKVQNDLAVLFSFRVLWLFFLSTYAPNHMLIEPQTYVHVQMHSAVINCYRHKFLKAFENFDTEERNILTSLIILVGSVL